MRVTPTQSPPFWLVGPFFLVAPIGLIAGGLLLSTASHDVFAGINTPRLVAVTHAIVIGWITTTIMGATYQLGPAVIGGRPLSLRIARVQFWIHLVAVPGFVWSLLEWNTVWMSGAGVLLVVSLSLYLVNAFGSLVRGSQWTLPRVYLLTSLAMLVLTAALGLTWVGALHHLWFPVTMGRLSAHAHLGLVGWLALTVMGVSYQLVPMFGVTRARPRYGWAALGLTGVATIGFAAAMFMNPPAGVRLALTATLACGPLLWAADQLILIRARSRRRLDIHGHATHVALAFLVLAAGLGVLASAGTPLTPDGESARWLLAYAAAGILGWVGTTVVGNSYKILPFLVWFHRYRQQAGLRPVPLMTDIYSERAAHAVLVALVTATLVLCIAALSGSLALFRVGGAMLAAAGVVHELALLFMLLPKQRSERAPATSVMVTSS